jgi:hypothetical protein
MAIPTIPVALPTITTAIVMQIIRPAALPTMATPIVIPISPPTALRMMTTAIVTPISRGCHAGRSDDDGKRRE